MRKLFAVVILLLASMVGCDSTVLTIDFGKGFITTPVITRPINVYPPFAEEQPTMNLEQVFRVNNWLGRRRQGSCVHASMTMLFRWQGEYALADKWRKTYGDGESAGGLSAKFDVEGVRYAFTAHKGDVSFLEWACDTRRGCGVTVMGGRHMVILAHLDSERAGILDNNSPGCIKWVPRNTFISEWKNSSSWAVTPIYVPPPLKPCS